MLILGNCTLHLHILWRMKKKHFQLLHEQGVRCRPTFLVSLVLRSLSSRLDVCSCLVCPQREQPSPVAASSGGLCQPRPAPAPGPARSQFLATLKAELISAPIAVARPKLTRAWSEFSPKFFVVLVSVNYFKRLLVLPEVRKK